jgi:hypothetical protein
MRKRASVSTDITPLERVPLEIVTLERVTDCTLSRK